MNLVECTALHSNTPRYAAEDAAQQEEQHTQDARADEREQEVVVLDGTHFILIPIVTAVTSKTKPLEQARSTSSWVVYVEEIHKLKRCKQFLKLFNYQLAIKMKLFFTTALALVAANAAAAANEDPSHTNGRLAADLVYVAADNVDVDASSPQIGVNANQAHETDEVSAHFSERVAVHTDGDGIIIRLILLSLLLFSSD